jgi:hypothetical protein
MADQADIAAQHDFTEEVLARHSKSGSVLTKRGACLYCETKIEGLYCDPECREQYEYEQRVQKNTGRK